MESSFFAEVCEAFHPSVDEFASEARRYRRYVSEYWTSRQRCASSLHEISYRACYKPQLPRFFIERLSEPGDLVFDPFGGRGTTALEAALLGRRAASNDVNPLSEILAAPRLRPPRVEEVERRLADLRLDRSARAEIDLSMFYHPETEGEIASLKAYLSERRASGKEDDLDRWIRMVATNRLTGHSSGFFSVYTFPPNQAVSAERQKLINAKRGQTPPYRDVRALILKKTRSLLKDVSDETRATLRNIEARFLTGDARQTPLAARSVRLAVTSPPFLNVVDYAGDNWLRCWFNGVDAEATGAKITAPSSVEEWRAAMGETLRELHRVVAPGGAVAFEVGEARGGTILLDEIVAPLGEEAGFEVEGALLNLQRFTKTANIWGVANNEKGTNTNRVVVMRRG